VGLLIFQRKFHMITGMRKIRFRTSPKHRVTSDQLLTLHQRNPFDDLRSEEFHNYKDLNEIDEKEDWDVDEVVNDGSDSRDFLKFYEQTR
jgi:hypothetical protein